MRFTGSQAEAHRRTTGVRDRVNLAGQSASRTAHALLSIARNAGDMLVHSHEADSVVSQ